MKTICALAALFALTNISLNAAEPRFDETTRFIFYSVLEGLYEDGVSTEDVEQILMRNDDEEYFHFIYACPVCMASIWAFDAYRSRPDQLHSVKSRASTFGDGLKKATQKELHSDDPKRRLTAINGLIKKWIDLRMDTMNLTDTVRKELRDKLEEKRERGMAILEIFRSRPKGEGDVSYYAPAYVGNETMECAACNGAVGKPMVFEKEE